MNVKWLPKHTMAGELPMAWKVVKADWRRTGYGASARIARLLGLPNWKPPESIWGETVYWTVAA